MFNTQNHLFRYFVAHIKHLLKSVFILTTSNIRIIPVGVFNGRKSQCNGTPHGADGIWFMYCL